MKKLENNKKSDLYSQFLKIKKQNSNFYSDYKKELWTRHFKKPNQRNLNSKKNEERIKNVVL